VFIPLQNKKLVLARGPPWQADVRNTNKLVIAGFYISLVGRLQRRSAAMCLCQFTNFVSGSSV